MLMEDHLRASGLQASADMLASEAGLARLPADDRAIADAAQGPSPFTPFSRREPVTPATQPSKGVYPPACRQHTRKA